MSNFAKCIATLKRYSLARIPFITFNSVERGRALDVFKVVSEEIRLPFYVHTLSKGMWDIATGRVVNEDRSVVGAMDYISDQIRQRQNLTFVLTEVSDIDGDTFTARQLLDVVTLAEECGGVIIVITTNPVWGQLQRIGMLLSLDLPNEDEMLQIIKENIEPYRRDILIEWDISDFREAATILAGVSRIEAQNLIASLIANRHISKGDLTELRFAKDKLFANISGLEKIDVAGDALNVGGLGGLKKWLDEKKRLQRPEKRDEMKARKLPSPRGILLVGVPGCGKSLSAKAIAVNWQLPLYRLDFATVQGSYVGQSEKQLKEALATAEYVSPCVLWIDEIEKGLSGAGSNDGGVSTRMVGQFLFWLQECKKLVFVVATANDVSQLPSELLRRGRFDELFFVDLPAEEERREIMQLYAQKYLQSELTGALLDELAELSDGFTGADIESAVREVGYRLVANDHLQISDALIKMSFQNVVPLSKTSPEKIEAIRAWGRERTVSASGKPIGGQEIVDKPRRMILV